MIEAIGATINQTGSFVMRAEKSWREHIARPDREDGERSSTQVVRRFKDWRIWSPHTLFPP